MIIALQFLYNGLVFLKNDLILLIFAVILYNKNEDLQISSGFWWCYHVVICAYVMNIIHVCNFLLMLYNMQFLDS